MSLFLISIFLALSPFNSKALVSSPSGIAEGEMNIELKAIAERGKVEPNENVASHHAAKINIYQLSVSRGLSGIGFGLDHFLRLDAKFFQSGREEVNRQIFYSKDNGKSLTVTYGFNFVHTTAHSAGIYASLTPYAKFNKDKFSLPRIDLWALGFRSGLELNKLWFIEDSVHYGSGFSGRQNSYLAFTHLFALRLEPLVSLPMILKIGPYAELDLKDRYDEKYDTAFSAVGRRDRIRAMKVGFLGTVDITFSDTLYSSLSYVQKLGGYDAPATNATALTIGANF
ncbi:MAG: hypothetical protein M9962_05610 [Oligoflexia bacterium]|nr:hypothetical protein [Oligoflexia bacterium]